jgi:uncharacterized protein (DUF1800 family)
MTIVTSRYVATAFCVAFLLLLSGATVFGQDDPDPNSPTPVLVSIEGSPRALAAPVVKGQKTPLLAQMPEPAFEPESKVRIFVGNVDLMKGEDANAFRVYAEDKNGHTYRFPVLVFEPINEKPGLYALVVRLKDDVGYWPAPTPDGDLLIYVSWRGLASNRLLLGYGRTGGPLEGQKGLSASPLSNLPSLSKTAKGEIADINSIGYKYSNDRIRFLEQATFGPTAFEDSRVRRIGLRVWLGDQFDKPYPSADNPFPNQPLKPTNAPGDCDGDNSGLNGNPIDVPLTCNRDTYTMYPMQTWFMREAFYGDAQLRLRTAWALSQIWVTSGVDIQQSRHMVEYFKILERNAFGNYRTLMKEMTLSPTMGDYLDMSRSTKNNPNENYAREIMQLFTVGLFMLNQDGTLQLDANNNPIPTYDQNNVNNLTKVLTGWTFCSIQANCPNIVAGTVNFIDPMYMTNANNHDTSAKTLLSYPGSTTTNIAACTNCTNNAANTRAYADASLDQALDNIFYHPNVGPFVSRTLIQQLVTSDPTPAYVSRIAAVFNNNGFGVRGDLKAVVKAILLDPEARGDVKTDPNYGKLREPVQLATNLARWTNVRGVGGGQSDGYLTGRGEFVGMSQNPFRSPTVFNYYPPDYVIPGTALLGPEFAIMTTGTAIQRANFVNLMTFNTIPVSSPNAPNGTALDFSELQSIVQADPTCNQLMDVLNQRMMHGTMSSQMRSTILTAVTSIASSNPLQRAKQAVYLIATSSQYQVQR